MTSVRHTLAALLLAGCSTDILPEGPAGEPGPAGADGRDGARGPMGPAWRPSTYTIQATAEVEPGEMAHAVAICDDGAMVLHGGCQWGHWSEDHYTAVRPYLSTPIGQAHSEDWYQGWQCQGENVSGEPTRVHVTATCIDLE